MLLLLLFVMRKEGVLWGGGLSERVVFAVHDWKMHYLRGRDDMDFPGGCDGS